MKLQPQLKAKGVLKGYEEKLRLGTTKKAYASLLVKVFPVAMEDPSLLVMPVCLQEQQQQWVKAAGASKPSCLCYRGES